MCSIFGIVKSDKEPIRPDLFGQMRDASIHRGPDDSGRYFEPGLAMGMNRLAIIDLRTGNQPIFNEDRSLVIIFNGEIFNHREIRTKLEKKGHTYTTNSDTETILHAFEEYGPDCVYHFNGMFAFAIWNISTKTLFLARDRLGIKPLYILKGDDYIAFASEAKCLLHLIPGGAKPDWNVLFRFFSFGYVPSPQSPFQDIEKILPGHYAWIRGTKIEKKCYFRPEYGLGQREDIDKVVVRVEELLEQAVYLELISDVPIGVFLSGGLDSSIVAYYANKRSSQKTCSFALRFEEETHDESSDARLVAEHLGLEHKELFFSRDLLFDSLKQVSNLLDEPFGDSTVLPLYALSRFAREHVKVILTGWGGDEIFAGYPTYKAHQYSSYYRRLPLYLSTWLVPTLVDKLPVSDKYMSLEFKAKRFVKGANLAPELQHFLWMGYFDDATKVRIFRKHVLEQVTEGTLDHVLAVLETFREKDLVSRIMHLDALFFLEGNGLFQADRMTMAASIEARVPLLNNDLLEYVNALPIDVKLLGGKLKGLLKRVLESRLPHQILKKPKKGFGPPSSVWTRGIFADLLLTLFSRERVEEQGIFNYHEIKVIMDEHVTKKCDHGRNLWALLSFQLWYDKFILGEPYF